ncbi:MAG TPA: hypothetical protein VGY77_02750 [Gemmataceae bacterium]|nr:hypothetical protein [Gemmataceae bacterium]
MFLLVVILGVTTYMGFDGQEQLRLNEKKAKEAAASKEKSRDWERLQNLLLKKYVGSMTDAEKTDYDSLISKYDTGTWKDEANITDFNKLVEILKTKLQWDETKKQPVKNFLNEVDALQQNLNEKEKQRAEAVKHFEEAAAKFKNDLADRDKAIETKSEEFKAAKKEAADAYAKKSTEYIANLTALEKLQNDLDDIKKKMDLSKDDAKKAMDKLTREITDQKLKIQRLNDQVKPINPLDYEQPKGKIVRVERYSQTVYINLGQRDNVKPQLTFSIYGIGANFKANPQRKGSLEVTKIIGPNLSQARITELTDANTDPVLPEDLIFNPAWSPSLRQHVAVAGLIDLTGDGKDDTPEFIRALRDQNIVVDSFIDLKDLTVKGEGMSLKTNFLVLGDNPDFENTPQQGDIRTDRKTELIKKMSEMQDEGKRLGVTIIPYRRFLTVVGFPMPRSLTTRSSSGFLESPKLGSKMEKKETDKDKEAKEKEK